MAMFRNNRGLSRNTGKQPLVGGKAHKVVDIGGGAQAGSTSGAVGNTGSTVRNPSPLGPSMPELGITMSQILAQRGQKERGGSV
jgi:hypothetical protein